MKFRRRLSPNVNLNLVPMIDIVFQLIIFFMVATTLSISPGIPIALPASTTAEQVVMTKLVVTNGTHGILVTADDFAADNMDISGNLGHGVVANFVNSLAVLTSQVNDNGLRGFDIVGMDGLLVSKSTVSGSGAEGIAAIDGANVRVDGTSVSGSNGTGVLIVAVVNVAVSVGAVGNACGLPAIALPCGTSASIRSLRP